MAAMEVVLANTIQDARPPVTDGDGGTSAGDPGAGGADVGRTTPEFAPISTADQAGAYILTILAIMGLVIGSVFVLMDESSHSSPSERLVQLRSVTLVAGSWSVGLLKLQSQDSSQLKEKEVDRSGGHLSQLGVAEKGTGMTVHSCVRTTQVSRPPVLHPRASRSWRSTQSEPSGKGTNRRSGIAEADRDRRNLSCPQLDGGSSASSVTAPRRVRGQNAGRVHCMETSWEEE